MARTSVVGIGIACIVVAIALAPLDAGNWNSRLERKHTILRAEPLEDETPPKDPVVALKERYADDSKRLQLTVEAFSKISADSRLSLRNRTCCENDAEARSLLEDVREELGTERYDAAEQDLLRAERVLFCYAVDFLCMKVAFRYEQRLRKGEFSLTASERDRLASQFHAALEGGMNGEARWRVHLNWAYEDLTQQLNG